MAVELHPGEPGARGESSAEQRRHVRVEVRLEVGFSIAGEVLKTTARAATRDISHGGACLVVTGCGNQLLMHLAELPLLSLSIDIPSYLQCEAAFLSFHGRVEWIRQPVEPGAPTLIGLEFRNLDAAAEVAIIDLIAHLLLSNRL